MFHSTSEIANRLPIDEDKEESDASPSETYNCDMCSSGGWTSETEVEVHKHMTHKQTLMELLHGDSEHLCRMCLTEFNSYTDLRKHILTEHLLSSEDAVRVEREIFICDICQSIFFNKKQLAVHIIHCHYRIRNSNKVECPRCNRYVTTKGIWFHYLRHNIQSVATCKICLYKCRNRSALKEHIQTHSKYLACDICLYQTKKEDLFKKHIQSKHERQFYGLPSYNFDKFFYPTVSNTRLFKCANFRGLALSNGFRLCILCRQICDNKICMHDHMYEHAKGEDVNVIKYECICGQDFSNKVLLKHHVFRMRGNHAPKDMTMFKQPA